MLTAKKKKYLFIQIIKILYLNEKKNYDDDIIYNNP